MHLRFAPIDQRYIKEKVESGFYSSETELVKDAVRHMREEEEKLKHFQDAVQIGDAQIAQGKTVPYNKDMIEKATKNAIKRAQNGEKPNPDVTD